MNEDDLLPHYMPPRDHPEETWAGPPPQEWAGYQKHCTSRTGTTVVLVNGHEQGVSSPGDGDGVWTLICDEHASILTDTNKRRLWRHARYSDDWCEGCREGT